jgi:hypothetical protein
VLSLWHRPSNHDTINATVRSIPREKVTMLEEIVHIFPASDDMVVEACLDPDGTESGPMLRLRSRSQEADGAVPLVVMPSEIKPLIDAIAKAAEWIAERPAESGDD